MQVLSEGKQQVPKDLRTLATDDQCFWFPLGLSLSSKNQTKVHPSETRYALLWPQHNSALVLLGSILELERCDQQCVQSSRFEKEFWQDVCMLEKRAPSSLLLILILDNFSLMMVLSSRTSYMTTTSAISGEMLRPCSSLSHDINTIVLNMHPRTCMCLAQLQQPGRCLFLALVYPFFNFF